MKIETKFSIGDEVWFKGYKNLPFVSTISQSLIFVGCDKGILISYALRDNNIKMESELFRTKQELLNSL